MEGSSMATPFVAAVAALMLDNGVPAASLKATIENTAVDWGGPGDDIEFGSGRLDAYRAITGTTDPTVRPVHAFHQSSLAATGAAIDYPINVTDTRFPVAATLVHPGISGASAATPDFDLSLLNPSGIEVARAYTSSRQETVALAPTATGTYTLRVRSYSGSGAFQLDWSAGAFAAATPVRTTITAKSLSPTGDLSTLSADDNRYFALASPAGATRSRTTSWVATFGDVPADITGLTVTYTGKNSAPCTLQLSLMKAGTWVPTYSAPVGTRELPVVTKPTDAAKDYVAANGSVKVRVRCTTTVDFTTYGELLTLRYDRLS
jgi:hypothetical protein